ncbi:MAG: hypothetical protein JO114_21605 [Planctomycetaceae bacterium]|nr:hypothetical protein [Planctomycetaceae bacterium]
MRDSKMLLLLAAAVALIPGACSRGNGNLLDDPSFEVSKSKDQFGLVFARWGGWKYEGDCDFRVGEVARTGKHSCLLYGGIGAKIRVAQNVELTPGRYRVTAYLRGLDIGKGTYNFTTEFMFDGKYQQLNKNGTFGWTKLTYVGEIEEKKQAGPSFGLMAPGYFWIDDVSLEKVGDDVPLTKAPVLGNEEAPIAPPGEIVRTAVRCSECGYRNNPDGGTCYACGAALSARTPDVEGPAVKLLASFEDRNPMSGGIVVGVHASQGRKSLRLDRSYVSLEEPQDWLGYDFLKADLYTEARKPLDLYVEIRDAATRDYWTRVNYSTVVPPGQSTLVIPIKQLYVGEKSRPGRMLDLAHITRLILAIGDAPAAPLFLDNLRLERDDSPSRVVFEGLHAFDFGTSTSPVMEAFTPITPSTLYSKGRGYGLKNARIWRAFDALQPDPLYQDFLCIEAGGLAVDLPNGKYRVFVNIDSPSGYWGEYQTYRKRAIFAERRPVVSETMDFEAFRKQYFRFWNVEDLPADNTFDKYQKAYYHEKQFDVEVTDGQLNLDFRGENWACCVSAVVIFPVEKAAQGERFLNYMEAKRRFYFENAFKRVLPTPTGDSLEPTAEDRRRGFVLFQRDPMQDISYNDTPFKQEVVNTVRGSAFAGEFEPVTVGVVPLSDLGKVTLSVGDLQGPAATIPARMIDVRYVSYRISRVTAEGSVYTISPRLILPGGTVEMPKNLTRRFWLTVWPPPSIRPGDYRGTISIHAGDGRDWQVPLEFQVRAGTLDPVDIPAGPFGHAIGIPWYQDDPRAAEYNRQMVERSLRRMRAYGFTACTGLPSISFHGFAKGKPILDFTAADRQMKLARDLGFLAVTTYGGGVSGFDAYYQDSSAMTGAGFQDYAAFVRAVYSAVQQHARRNHWIPVYYNLADEPLGQDAIRAAENAEAYRRAFPKGPPFFTGASSFTGSDRNDPHFRLSKALHVVSWNNHDEPGVALLHAAGSDWAFYNGGNRWTFGTYMFKAAREYGMKFRISWHWNVVAGDPYYALDCREDDYAWCNASPTGRLIPSVEFERLREGLDDYRRLITLDRLAKEHPDTPAARAARELIATRMKSFHLGQRDHDALFPSSDWSEFRRTVDDAIERLRQ